MAEPPLRVLFIISSIEGWNTKSGGHYHSCATLARALAEEVETTILNVGGFIPDALRTLDLPVHHVHFDRCPTPATWFRLVDLVERIRPSHLHAFDAGAYFAARLLAARFRLPLVLTKPGGANGYSPRCRNVIAFSQENHEDLRKRYAGQDIALHWLPNRLLPVPADEDRIAAVRNFLASDCPVFLRIARLAKDYKESIWQTVRLVEDLNTAGYPCQALIIGEPQHDDVAEAVTALRSEQVAVLSEPRFTRAASALIPVADFVCGTGRSLMEAAVHGRILLTPMRGRRYPLLVDHSNVDQLLWTNFSPRNFIEGVTDADVLGRVQQILIDAGARADMRAFAHELAQRFDARTVVPRYVEIYRSETGPSPLYPADLFAHGARLAKLLVKTDVRRRRAAWSRSRTVSAQAPGAGLGNPD